MICDRPEPFLFVHIPKTAGTSVETALVSSVLGIPSLAGDWAGLCEVMGWGDIGLPHLNRTRPFLPWWEYYDEEAAELVRERFARDFEEFGYPAALPRRAAKEELLSRTLWIGRGEPPPDALRQPVVSRHGRLELPEACVGNICLYGALEMKAPDEVLALLREFRRVLHPEGLLRIHTLDLEFIAGLVPAGYEPGSVAHDFVRAYSDKHLPDSGSYSPPEVLNHLMRRDGQRFLYDEPLIAELLDEAGFHGERMGGAPAGEIAVVARRAPDATSAESSPAPLPT